MRTLEVIGGKWKPIILHYLNEAPRRTGELSRLMPHASSKMLTQQLRELENDGVVKRRVYTQVPPKVEYSLTERGRSLRPIIRAMSAWAVANPKAKANQSPGSLSAFPRPHCFSGHLRAATSPTKTRSAAINNHGHNSRSTSA